MDEHEIYSNIGADPLAITAVDAYTGRVLAHTERLYDASKILLFGGRSIRVVWREKYRFGLAAAPNQPAGAGCYLFHFWGTVWGLLLTAVIQQLNFPRLAQTYQAAHIISAPHLAEQLHMLSSA